MADHSRHPLYSAIQQSMVSITKVVQYDEVKDQMFAEDLVTSGDLDEYDKLTNAEAVRRMTRKVMSSITGCEKFLEILQEMDNKSMKNSHNLSLINMNKTGKAQLMVSHTGSQFNEEQITAVCEQVVSKNEVDELMQEGKL